MKTVACRMHQEEAKENKREFLTEICGFFLDKLLIVSKTENFALNFFNAKQ